MKRFKAFIFDIDGTIMPGERTLSSQMKAMIQKIIDQKFLVAFATGRNLKFASEIANQFKGSFYLAINNGSVIIQYPEQKITRYHHLNIADVETIRHYLATNDHPCIVNGTVQNGEKTYIFHDPPPKEPILNFVKNTKKEYFKIQSLKESNENEFGCLYGTVPSKVAFQFYDDIRSDHSLHNFKIIADPICKGFHWLGLMPQGTGKEAVLDYFKKYYQIDPMNVLAAGDDFNDLELLKSAGHSIAMGTAPSQVKECAKEVIGSAEDESLYHYLKKILPFEQ